MSETTTATILVPGQPVLSAVNAKGPALKYGAGTYERDGVVRASLVGSLENKSGVRGWILSEGCLILMNTLSTCSNSWKHTYA